MHFLQIYRRRTTSFLRQRVDCAHALAARVKREFTLTRCLLGFGIEVETAFTGDDPERGVSRVAQRRPLCCGRVGGSTRASLPRPAATCS